MFFAPSAIAFPVELSQALAEGFAPTLGHTSTLASRHGAALRRLWEPLAKRRGQKQEGEQHYSFRKEEALAYGAYYLPVNCLKPALILEESFLLGDDPVPAGEAEWLDLGTGPGTAFWGLAWWFASRGKKLRFCGWDQSPAFAGLGRSLTAGNPMGANAEFLLAKEDPFSLIQKRRPTHVSFVNSLAEIYPDRAKRETEIGKILQALRELQKADGRARFLLLLEPGSRDSSRELAALKDGLQAAGLGEVRLPCLDSRACGALARPDDWCHEEVACEFPLWVNELGSEAGMRKEAMLFSYAWIRADRAGENARANGLRMVSQRLERKGQVECWLCTKEGKRSARVQRSKVQPASEPFLKAHRGALWRQMTLGEKGDVLDMVPFSSPLETIFQPHR